MNSTKGVNPSCTFCHKKESDPDGYCKGEISDRMRRDALCFICAFWEVEVERPHDLVIDGCIYSIGKGGGGGMAGRTFEIEYFDGRRVTTNDLWAGGVIPESLRDKIPDTAEFCGGAKRVTVGETTCWNASESSSVPSA